MRKNILYKSSLNFSLIALTVLLVLNISGCGSTQPANTDFRVDFITNLGTDPIFSWKKGGDYKILVATQLSGLEDGTGDVWDSGRQPAISSLQIPYSGPGLESGKRYYAAVRTWDTEGEDLGQSNHMEFVVPLEYPADWKAQWLTYSYAKEDPLPLFRKEFEFTHPEEIDYARFYIAAPGYYEASLNGEKIGESVLDPGQTNYEDYTYYSAYDINPADLAGESVIGVMLGNGWYNQNQVWKGQAEYSNMVYGQPVFMCQLVIHRSDGSNQIIGSDQSWKWAEGPITYSNVYGGEHYDARLEVKGWDLPGVPEAKWNDPESPDIHPTLLYEQFAEPIRAMGQIEVKEIIERGNGTYILDFGQNMAGWLKLKVDGEAGQEITVRTTEELDAEGNIDPTTTGVQATHVVQTQKYICRGGGTEIWEPRFTYMGFRYAEVSGLRQAPSKELLTGIILHSAVPDVGDFQCSEENINKLHELSRWTIIGNIHSIPTDCPHREKCGWTGDSHAMIQAMIYNYDSQRFFSKYMFDMRSSGREEKEELYFGESFYDRSMVMKPAGIPTMIVPGKRTSGVATPDWGTALVQIPWYLYLYYGDQMLLEDFYPDMQVWVEYIHAKCEDGIVTHGLGDWCPPGGNVNIDCPVPVSSSAYHILDVSIMKKVSKLLGNDKDYARYSEMLEQLKLDFNRHFFQADNVTYGSQTADAMALEIGIVPDGYQKEVAGSIIKNMSEAFDGFVNTGIFGLARIFKALSENGYEEEVYGVLTKTGRNSFAFMWDHYDATTLWEVLPTNSEFGSTYAGSMNHPMQAGFDAWFYSGIAGINPTVEGPGFQKIEFKPYLTRHMRSASASYESKSGTIVSEWEGGSGELTWNIQIPANSKGIIHVPTYESGNIITVNGKLVKASEETDGFSNIGSYGPGKYQIRSSVP